MRRLGVALAALLLTTVAACSSDGSDTGDEESPNRQDEQSAPPASDGAGGMESSQTWEDAEKIDAETDLLNWGSQQTGDASLAATSRGWTAVADTLGRQVRITGPGPTMRFRVQQGRVQALEMQWPWAVVYAGGSLTGGPSHTKHGQLAVFDLRSGKRRMVGVDGSAPRPSASGSVSMHDGELAYATGPNNHYCIARLDLSTLDGKRVDCAEPLKEGFTQFTLTPHALGYTSFDNQRPDPCMTLKAVRDDSTDAVSAARNCSGWEVVPGEDSAVWVQIRNRHRVERGRAYAREPNGDVVDLGPVMSGSTTWCGGATYFVRPASKDGRADTLMRWSPESGLDVVWKPTGTGVSFVFAPHCGGSSIALPALDRSHSGIMLSAPV